MSDMKQARADLLQMIKDDPDMPQGLTESFDEVFTMADAGLSPEEIRMIQDMRYGEQLKIKLKGINTERKI